MSRAHPALVVALCALAAVLLPTAPARAGSYYVYTCQPDGAAHGWTPYDTAHAVAYIDCGSSATGAGLRARNLVDGGWAPGFSFARLMLAAPPGAYFDWMRFDADLRAQQGWRAGIHDVQHNTWIWCGTSACTHSFGWRQVEVPMSTTTVGVLTICGELNCGPNTETWGNFGIRNVTLRVQDPIAPSLTLTGGSLLSGGWLRGAHGVSVASSDNTGLGTLQLLIDGREYDRTSSACDYHLVSPCVPGMDGVLSADLRGISDGSHDVAVVATDAAGNTAQRSSTVLVDGTAPDRITGLEASPHGWSAATSFNLSWTNPPSGGGAPITSAFAQLCADECLPVERHDGQQISTLALSVPAPGRWNLRLWVGDAAGNADAATAQTVELLSDTTAPSVRILDRLESEPGTIYVEAFDQLSGLATTELEVRREADHAWHSIPTSPTEDGFSGIIDDETLPGGKYQLRARVSDRAGNERTMDGPVVELPFRLSTELTVGERKRVRAQGIGGRRFRRILVTNPVVKFGRPSRLKGRLVSPGGNPLADRDIDVADLGEATGASWMPVATVRTDAEGRFVFDARPGPSRQLRFRFAGSATVRGNSTFVTLRVRAATTLLVSRKRVINGEAVTFKGTVQGEVPTTGKLLQLQVFARGTWLTFATPRADQRGRWTHEYRFTATRGITQYRFRARLPRESGFPYVPGRSRQVSVKVIGL